MTEATGRHGEGAYLAVKGMLGILCVVYAKLKGSELWIYRVVSREVAVERP